MQLPESFTKVTPLSKILALILFVSLPFMGFYFGYNYALNMTYETGNLSTTAKDNSPIPTNSLRPTISVAVAPSMVGIMGEIPVVTKQITYRKDKSIFARNLNTNILSSEKSIASANYPINYYVASQNLKFVVYTYYSKISPKNLGDMSGYGDEVILKDLSTGKSKTVLSNLTKNNLAATFSFVNNSNKLYISLDNNDIFSYDISSNQLIQVYKVSDNNSEGFCRGFYVVDESPNGKNLIVNSRCYEGTVTYIYNIDSKTFTQIGGGYGSGTHIIKFLNDDQVYGYRYGEAEDNQYLKINLQGGIVQELPKPTSTPTPFFGLYHDSNTNEIFIADQSKSRVPDQVDVNSRQTIGFDVKEINFYPSF